MSPRLLAPEFLAPIFSVDGITAIGICTWMDAIYPNWLAVHVDYEKSSAIMRDYCEIFKVSYYARPHEDCFDFEAVEQAKAEGKKFVIIEDMS